MSMRLATSRIIFRQTSLHVFRDLVTTRFVGCSKGSMRSKIHGFARTNKIGPVF
jgi:hypothetical protein